MNIYMNKWFLLQIIILFAFDVSQTLGFSVRYVDILNYGGNESNVSDFYFGYLYYVSGTSETKPTGICTPATKGLSFIHISLLLLVEQY
jgi:hypothetical protein